MSELSHLVLFGGLNMTEPKQVDEKEVELKEFSAAPELMIEPDVSLHFMSSVPNFNSLLTGIAKNYSINIPKAKEKAIGITYLLTHSL